MNTHAGFPVSYVHLWNCGVHLVGVQLWDELESARVRRRRSLTGVALEVVWIGSVCGVDGQVVPERVLHRAPHHTIHAQLCAVLCAHSISEEVITVSPSTSMDSTLIVWRVRTRITPIVWYSFLHLYRSTISKIWSENNTIQKNILINKLGLKTLNIHGLPFVSFI